MKLSEVNENDKSFDYKYLTKRMFPFIKPYLWRAILGILIAIPVGLLDGVVAFALRPYLDEVVVNKNAQFAAILPMLIIAFALIQGVLKYMNVYLTSWAGGKLTNNLKITLYNKLIQMDSGFYHKNSSGIILNRFLNDADIAMTGIINNSKQVISTTCSSAALIFVLIYNSWQLASVAVLILLSAMLPMKIIRKKIKEISHKTIKLGGQVVTTFNETCSGHKIISSYNLENHQARKYSAKVEEGFDLAITLVKRVGLLSPVMYLIASCGIAMVMWFGNHLILSGQITSGAFASFITALLLLYRPIKSFGNVLAGMQTSFVSMARVLNILDIEPEIKNVPDAQQLKDITSEILFDNISFGYEENQTVINGMTLEVKKGETVALVGNSGGGKTTMVNLLPRFYDVREGAILIDGKDIRGFSIESLRENIAVVFQDNFLFSGTIKDNILLGNFEASDEQISQAIKNAYLEEFIESLPKGIDTKIGERGVKLSGGQRQRLAIARAMIKDAPILILDEATSALDNKSEEVVHKALEKLMCNRTVFVIAHRLSTVNKADKIAVIDRGHLVELGNHQELMTKDNGVYKSLYNTQFKDQEVVA